MTVRIAHVLLAAAMVWPYVAGAAQQGAHPKSKSAADTDPVQRGRYLVKIAGCNDCHTPGYAMANGKIAESQWLTGDPLGWRGPWGTTYAINLRLYMHKMTEDQWVKRAKTMETRPPMPWFALRDMTERDLRAIYQYVKTLTPVGEPGPAYVPPDREPKGPYVQFPGK